MGLWFNKIIKKRIKTGWFMERVGRGGGAPGEIAFPPPFLNLVFAFTTVNDFTLLRHTIGLKKNRATLQHPIRR